MAGAEHSGDSEHSLYRRVILEHARQPRNAERVEPHSHIAEAVNPLCGDEAEVTLRLEAERIAVIGARVRGCVISQAAASLMTEAVRGLPLARAAKLGEVFRQAIEQGETAALPPELAPLAPLIEVRKHRSRIRCALLAWEAIEEIADKAEAGKAAAGGE